MSKRAYEREIFVHEVREGVLVSLRLNAPAGHIDMPRTPSFPSNATLTSDRWSRRLLRTPEKS